MKYKPQKKAENLPPLFCSPGPKGLTKSIRPYNKSYPRKGRPTELKDLVCRSKCASWWEGGTGSPEVPIP